MDPFTIMLIIQMVIAAVTAAAQAQQQKKVAKQQAEAANQQVAQRWKQQQQEEKKRQEKLKVDLAKKRAKMGSQGLSAADGSAGAVIQGLRNTTAEESFDSFQETKKAADNSLASIQANLLETSSNANRTIYNQLGKGLGAGGNSFLKSQTKQSSQIKRDPNSMVQGLLSGDETPTTTFVAEKN